MMRCAGAARASMIWSQTPALLDSPQRIAPRAIELRETDEAAAFPVINRSGEPLFSWPFRGSDVVGRRSRDRFRFAGYRTGNVACSRPLGRQQKRRAARHSQAPAEDSRAAEDSRNTRAAGPDNRVLGSTG